MRYLRSNVKKNRRQRKMFSLFFFLVLSGRTDFSNSGNPACKSFTVPVVYKQAYQIVREMFGLQNKKKKKSPPFQLFLFGWFPGPPLVVSNDESTTQRLSVFVGHSPGVGYPSSRFIPDKLLSPWRVSSGHQPDSLLPGSIYNIYNWLFTIKICTILYTMICAINNSK